MIETVSTSVWVFVGLVVFVGVARSWLELRNCRYLQTRSRQEDRYAIARGKVAAIEAIANAGLILWWTIGGGLVLIDGIWTAFSPTLPDAATAWTGIAVLVTVAASAALLTMIFTIIRVFGVDSRFGLNRISLQSFLADRAKRAALGLLFLVPVGLAALWIVEVAPTYWWLFLWALWSALDLARDWLYPVTIAPLFDHVTPLEDGPLRSRLLALARRAGLATDRIEVVDASRRTGHANASFAGLGKGRRIILHDTLISILAPEEIEAVVAHELGHRSHAHIPIYLAAVSLVRLGTLATFAWIVSHTSFLQSIGFAEPPPHVILVLMGLLIVALAPLVQPVRSRMVRGFEYQADAFAGKLTPGADLISALVKLHRNNRTAAEPDPLYAMLLMPHPLLEARAQHLAVEAR